MNLVPLERIERAILLIRGQKVMLDTDLAELYGVETGALNRAVKRNPSRFPQDFMLQLTLEEVKILKCQIGISSWGGRRRSSPYAFTEQGWQCSQPCRLIWKPMRCLRRGGAMSWRMASKTTLN